MKALKLIIIGIILFLASDMQAQVSVSVNIGSPPQWGPVGYDNNVRYYYLPDVEAYYDLQTAMFIYYGGGVWIHRKQLPLRYRNYDLYKGYKVVMTDYRGKTPYIYFKEYKIKYAKGYRGHEQKTYGMKPGNTKTKKQSKGNSHSKGKSNKKH